MLMRRCVRLCSTAGSATVGMSVCPVWDLRLALVVSHSPKKLRNGALTGALNAMWCAEQGLQTVSVATVGTNRLSPFRIPVRPGPAQRGASVNEVPGLGSSDLGWLVGSSWQQIGSRITSCGTGVLIWDLGLNLHKRHASLLQCYTVFQVCFRDRS